MSRTVVVAALLAVVVAIATLGRLRHATLAGPPRTPSSTVGSRRSRRFGRRVHLDEVAMAQWCEHAARAVRAGHSLQRGVIDASTASPIAGAAFKPAIHAVERGRRLSDALGELDDDPARPVGLVAQVLVTCAELGGPAAAPLERTALTLHARAAERAERWTASAQARLSARVLTALPMATLGLLLLVEPDVRVAAVSPPGVACIGLGALASGSGWWWMRRIIGRSR